jgi:hypothetical protein
MKLNREVIKTHGNIVFRERESTVMKLIREIIKTHRNIVFVSGS